MDPVISGVTEEHPEQHDCCDISEEEERKFLLIKQQLGPKLEFLYFITLHSGSQREGLPTVD